MSFITAQANKGGSVYLQSCDSCSDAASISGRVMAQGTGYDGIGGEIKVKANNGGIFLPGVNNCLATGQHCNGHICLEYHSVIGPNCPPIVLPAPSVHQIP